MTPSPGATISRFARFKVLRAETEQRAGARVELSEAKSRAAAGLGGASSDAAAALIGGRDLWRSDVSDGRLHEIASELGSDVPFFLRGGCAVGRGRGDNLDPLPVPQGLWFVVVVPAATIPRKTASSIFAPKSANWISVTAHGSRLRRRV